MSCLLCTTLKDKQSASFYWLIADIVFSLLVFSKLQNISVHLIIRKIDISLSGLQFSTQALTKLTEMMIHYIMLIYSFLIIKSLVVTKFTHRMILLFMVYDISIFIQLLLKHQNRFVFYAMITKKFPMPLLIVMCQSL